MPWPRRPPVADCPRPLLTATEQRLGKVVDAMHKANKHAGQGRWGNTWIAQADLDAHTRDNAALYAKIQADQTQLAALQKQIPADTKAVEDFANNVRQHSDIFASGNQLQDMQNRLLAMRTELRKMTTKEASLYADIAAIGAKRNNPPHASSLLLLDSDGRTEFEQRVRANRPPAGRRARRRRIMRGRAPLILGRAAVFWATYWLTEFIINSCLTSR